MSTLSNIKSNPLIISDVMSKINLLLTNYYQNILIKNFDISQEMISDEEKIKFLKDGIEEFADYNLEELKKDIKEMSTTSSKKLFNDTIKNITKDMEKNITGILMESINGDINTLEKIAVNNVDNIKINALSLLKEKIGEIENKINSNIFPLINDRLNILEKKDLEKMKKSLEIKKEIEELSKNDNDLEKINKLKKEYIILFEQKNITDIEQQYEETKSKFNGLFFDNMKSLNKIKRIKETMGMFLNTETLKKIAKGEGQVILYNFVYKLSIDTLISNILKMQTDSSYLIKNITKKNQTYEKDILAKMVSIKSTGDINKDYACACVLNEIETTLEIRDLKITREIGKKIRTLTNGIIKDTENISKISTEEITKKIEDFKEEHTKKIEDSINEYKNIYQNLNKTLEEHIEKIEHIDDNIENMFQSIDKIDVITNKNVNDLTDVFNKQKEIIEKRNQKINELRKIEETIKQRILSLHTKKEISGLNDITIIQNELLKEENDLSIIQKEIYKESNLIKIINDTLNKESIDKIMQVSNSPEEYKKEIENLKSKFNDIKSNFNFDKEIKIVDKLKEKLNTDIEFIKNIDKTIIEKSKDLVKDITHYEDLKSLSKKVLEMFDVGKEIKNYSLSKTYLRTVSEVIKTYGYKDNIDLYFKEMSEISDKKLEIYKDMELITKKLDFLEKISGKFPKEVIENNGKEKITMEMEKLISEMEMKKLELLEYLSNKNNKSINENMFNIDNDFKNFITDKNSIKEIRIMQIIKKGTKNSKPTIKENYLEKSLENEKEIKKNRLNKTNLEIMKNLGLNISLSKNKNYEISYERNLLDKLSNKVSNFLFDDEYNDKHYHRTEINVLSNGVIKDFFVNKDELTFKLINKNETSLSQEIKEIKTDNDIAFNEEETNLNVLNVVNERNKITINYLNKIEKLIEKDIKNNIEKENNDVNLKSKQQEKENSLFFEEYFVELFNIDNTDKENLTKLRENIKDLFGVTTSNKEELKKVLNNKANEIINSGDFIVNKKEFKLLNKDNSNTEELLNKSKEIRENEIILEKIKDFVINNNIKQKDNIAFYIKTYSGKDLTILDILNDIKSLTMFSQIENTLIEKINNSINNLDKNKKEHNVKVENYSSNIIENNELLNNLTEEEKNKVLKHMKEIILKIEVNDSNEFNSNVQNYINKNYTNKNQYYLNIDSNIIDKIADNNENYLSSNSYTVKKILEMDDFISSKINELNIKYELGKDFYTIEEKDNILYNIKTLKILYNKMKNNFINHFNNKQTKFDLIKNINYDENKTDLVMDLVYYKNKEEMFNGKEKKSLNIKQYVIELKEKLKQNELKGDKTKIKAFIKYFVNTKDSLIKINMLPEEREMSLYLFNEILKDNNEKNNLLENMEKIEEVNVKYKDLDYVTGKLQNKEVLEENQKINIKKRLKEILLKDNGNNPLIEVLIEKIDISFDEYMKKLEEIKSMIDLINTEITEEEKLKNTVVLEQTKKINKNYSLELS